MRMWICAGFVAACVSVPSVTAASDQKVDKGKELFATQKCTLCHSAEGKGNAKGSLDGVGSKLSAAEIKQWIVDPVAMTEKTKATRKPAMKAKPMPADEVDALVAYLSSLKKK